MSVEHAEAQKILYDAVEATLKGGGTKKDAEETLFAKAKEIGWAVSRYEISTAFGRLVGVLLVDASDIFAVTSARMKVLNRDQREWLEKFIDVKMTGGAEGAKGIIHSHYVRARESDSGTLTARQFYALLDGLKALDEAAKAQPVAAPAAQPEPVGAGA